MSIPYAAVSSVLTVACRFAGQRHEDCQGHIYLGSILGEPSKCECKCHQGEQ